MLTYKGFAFVGGEEIESEIVAPYQAQSEDVTLIFNISRICPESPTVTDYDGNLYYTVLMGEQCWMRENLRTTHYVHWNLADVRLCGGQRKIQKSIRRPVISILTLHTPILVILITIPCKEDCQ